MLMSNDGVVSSDAAPRCYIALGIWCMVYCYCNFISYAGEAIASERR